MAFLWVQLQPSCIQQSYFILASESLKIHWLFVCFTNYSAYNSTKIVLSLKVAIHSALWNFTVHMYRLLLDEKFKMAPMHMQRGISLIASAFQFYKSNILSVMILDNHFNFFLSLHSSFLLSYLHCLLMALFSRLLRKVETNRRELWQAFIIISIYLQEPGFIYTVFLLYYFEKMIFAIHNDL